MVVVLLLGCFIPATVYAEFNADAYGANSYGGCAYGRNCLENPAFTAPTPKADDPNPKKSFIQTLLSPGAAVERQLKSLLRRLSPAQQRAITFYVWLLLLVMALFLLLQAALDKRRTILLGRVVVLLKKNREELENFWRLILHHLNTPLAKINTTLELLVPEPVENKQAILHFTAADQLLKETIDQAAQGIDEQSIVVSSANFSVGKVTLLETMRRWYFIIPVTIAGLIVLLLNRLLGQISSEVNPNLFIQLMVAVVAAIIFASALRIRRLSRHVHTAVLENKALIDGLNSQRQQVIGILAESLSGVVQELNYGSRSTLETSVSQLVVTASQALQRLAYKANIISKPVLSQPEACNVAHVLNEIDERFESEIDDKKLTVETDFPGIANVNTYVPELYMVLSLVLENAFAFSPVLGVIRVGLKIQDSTFELVVTDRGPGISEEQQRNLFTPFSNSSSSVEAGGEGIGLSLFACKLVAERVGGKISLTSQPGTGTAVTITFPHLPTHQATVVAVSPS